MTDKSIPIAERKTIILEKELIEEAERVAKDPSLPSLLDRLVTLTDGAICNARRFNPSGAGRGHVAMIFNFGQHRWKSIKDIPIDCVLWLLAQRWFGAKYPDMYRTARGRAMQHYSAQIVAEQRLRSAEDFV